MLLDLFLILQENSNKKENKLNKRKNASQHTFFNNHDEILVVHYYDEPIQLRALFCEELMTRNQLTREITYDSIEISITILCKNHINLIPFSVVDNNQQRIDNCLDMFIKQDKETIESFIRGFEYICHDLCTEIFNDYLQKQLENKPKQRTMKI